MSPVIHETKHWRYGRFIVNRYVIQSGQKYNQWKIDIWHSGGYVCIDFFLCHVLWAFGFNFKKEDK